jgi:hypothetical protein
MVPAVAALVAVVALSCGDAGVENAMEESAVATEDVTAAVREKAVEIGAALGPGVGCREWFWDGEDGAWECPLEGLERTAELDITHDARFSELEFVYSVDEVVQVVPHLAEMITETCGAEGISLVELSIRSEELLDPRPDLAALWSRGGVFLEVQCANGYDFEVDPFGAMVATPDDDIDTVVEETE